MRRILPNWHVALLSACLALAPLFLKGGRAGSLDFTWAEPINISNTAADSHSPAIAVDGNGVAHVVWEDGGEIYHSYGSDGSWSVPARVATGEEPAIAIDGSNTPHLVFSNEIGGNYEIYYCFWDGSAWSLPRNVSDTSGGSFAPDIAWAMDGTIHVVWADNTPGYSVIYHAYSTDGISWVSAPIPSATGSAPSVALGSDGLVHLVWQERDSPTSPYEIYHCQWDGEAWSLPENISDTPDDHSIAADIAAADDGTVHLVWQEMVGGKFEIYYSGGEGGFWSLPENISETPADSYLPRIAIDGDNNRHVAWDEGSVLLYRRWQTEASDWSNVTGIGDDPHGIAEVALCVDAEGTVHVVWAEFVAANNWDIYYSYQTPAPTPSPTATPTSYRIHLPYIFRNYLDEAASNPVEGAFADSSTRSRVVPGHQSPPPVLGSLSSSATSWTEALNISHTEKNSQAPSVAVKDLVHVVWEEEGEIYHCYGSGTSWSEPARVATGERPAIAIGGDGIPHVVFANETFDNYEIYHCRWDGSAWSLPRNVSSTSGGSYAPDIAIAPDGTIHVVWADNTPGYSIIYHAYWNGTFWINGPIPSAIGGAPSIAIGSDGIVHTAWQDRDEPGAPYEIYHSQWDGEVWSLPENISDTPDEHSIAVDMAVASDGITHLVWEEGGLNSEVFYSEGRISFWSVPGNVSQTAADSYLPSIVVDVWKNRHVAWDERVRLLYRRGGVARSDWSVAASIAEDSTEMADVAICVKTNGELHAVWAHRITAANWDIFYSNRPSELSFRIYLPFIFRNR